MYQRIDVKFDRGDLYENLLNSKICQNEAEVLGSLYDDLSMYNFCQRH